MKSPKYFSSWLKDHPSELKFSSLNKMRRMYSEYYCRSFGTFQAIFMGYFARTDDEFKELVQSRNPFLYLVPKSAEPWQYSTITEVPFK